MSNLKLVNLISFSLSLIWCEKYILSITDDIIFTFGWRNLLKTISLTFKSNCDLMLMFFSCVNECTGHFPQGLKYLNKSLYLSLINKCAYSAVHMVAAGLHMGCTPYPEIHLTSSFCKICKNKMHINLNQIKNNAFYLLFLLYFYIALIILKL